ncbi:MAG: putative DNA binding domain-containing protein [Zoogloeaceae bacterium]|jgi:ATP-dependent DNA helicase RecG|nr:putative DNA binding domain-containing protein [Zoogloeaceae bacterium]
MPPPAFDPDQGRRLLDVVLSGQESQFMETKRVSGKMVGKALETVCAFANTRGGILFLGVEDAQKAQGRDRLYGIDENQEAVDELVRKLETHFLPKIKDIQTLRFSCRLRDGKEGELVLIHVPQSERVHSILDDGTWMRGQASNREMSAEEIAELSYRRGVRSAESEPVDVDFELLETEMWRLYRHGRGLTDTGIQDQLHRIGLARKVDGALRPLCAAVLLFADYPGALLAATGSRADVRVFHYRGNVMEAGETPNLVKPPKTLSGPVYRLIAQTHAYVLDELAEGLTLAASGFRAAHRYPERVIREAITNALIHRDYRLNQDVQVRIFDNRVEVLSPGMFPGRITAATIRTAGSFARNPLIASNLREFPDPPNVDAGEGVRMMFHLMRTGNLYPPQYREWHDPARQSITVTLLNEERPPVWEQVSDWIDRHGPISNGNLRKIAALDTLGASKLLKRWVEQGLLESDPAQGKRNRVYHKPAIEPGGNSVLLSNVPDNNQEIT